MNVRCGILGQRSEIHKERNLGLRSRWRLALSISLRMSNTTMSETEKTLQNILDKITDGKKIIGSSFRVKHDNFEWAGASGNMNIDSQYFIASTTKLFTTAIILNLMSRGKLKLGDLISNYVSKELLSGLHVYKGVDHSNELTIEHLLAHTSGLPDYFQDKGIHGASLEVDLMQGNDQNWTLEQALARTKSMKPFFAPGTSGKAHYSDANFQLLGHIIEKITGGSFAKACDEFIFQPLALKHTYLFQDLSDKRPVSLYYKTQPLLIPKAMISFGPDGGIVSTTSEMMIFVQAFFQGKLFPATYLSDLQKWNRIFFPLKSGVGIHLFKLPWFFNPTGAVPYFIGHSGLSGALAFYAPQKNLFVVGTVNQVASPDMSFRAMIKLTQAVMKIKG